MKNDKNHSPLDDPKMKENIFQVPDAYFDQLADRVMLEVKEDGLLSNNHLKEPIFEAPEGYFDQLQQNVLDKIEEEEGAKVISLRQNTWWRYAVAAAVVIFAVVMGLRSNKIENGIELENVSNADIIEYLVDEGLSSYDIVAWVDDGETVLGEFLTEEWSLFDQFDDQNPELDFDLDYLDY